MRYGLTIWTMLGLAGDGLSMNMWAETQQRQQVRLVGRVIDEAHRPVEGVEVIVNRREVRGMTDSVGFFQLDVVPSDSTVGFRRIGYRPMIFTIHPLPPTRDTILVALVNSPVQLPEVIVCFAWQATPLCRDHQVRRRIPPTEGGPRHPHPARLH